MPQADSPMSTTRKVLGPDEHPAAPGTLLSDEMIVRWPANCVVIPMHELTPHEPVRKNQTPGATPV